MQLRLQSQLQKRESLINKRGELTAQIESLDREIKVARSRLIINSLPENFSPGAESACWSSEREVVECGAGEETCGERKGRGGSQQQRGDRITQDS